MRLSKNFIMRSFFVMIVYCSSIVIALSNEILYDPHCQSHIPEHLFNEHTSKAGHNSFTASQIKKRLTKNGFRDIKQLRLDDKGIWRALVEFNKCHFLISVDYSGIISIPNESK